MSASHASESPLRQAWTSARSSARDDSTRLSESARSISEQTQLYAEIFLWILTEIVKKLNHLAGRLIQIVVQLVIVKQLAGRALTFVQSITYVSKRCDRCLDIIVKFLVFYQLAERAAPRVDIRRNPVELLGRGIKLRQKIVRLLVEFIVGHKLAERSFPGTHVGKHALYVVGCSAQILVEFRIVEQLRDRTVSLSNPRADVLKLEHRAVQVHIKCIIVQKLADRSLTLVYVVHQFLKLLTYRVELHEDIACASKNLRETLLIRAGYLPAICYGLSASSSGRNVDYSIPEKTLLSEDSLRIPPDSLVDFFSVDDHNHNDWFLILAGGHGPKLNAVDLADVLAGEPHFIALLQTVCGCKSSDESGVMFEEGDPAADAQNKNDQDRDRSDHKDSDPKFGYGSFLSGIKPHLSRAGGWSCAPPRR